jgi:uncharacterized membrane protein required for colicin V production
VHVQQATQGGASEQLVHTLQTLEWVDQTTLGVLLVFFVLGLFKGLIWQVSRIGILVAAYVVSGRYGNALADWLARSNEADAPTDPSSTTIYLAYCLLFVAVLVVLSLLAIGLQRLATKAGLGFFDRLGGGVLGLATGAGVVVFAVFVVNMFFRGSQLAYAAERSHTARLSRRLVEALGPRVPPELRQVFALPPLPGNAPAAADDAPDAPPGDERRNAGGGEAPMEPPAVAPDEPPTRPGAGGGGG